MDVSEVQRLIEQGEGQGIEFKSRASEAGESICAFANTNGGIILVGVSDKKKIVGCAKADEHRIANIAQSCQPPVHPKIDQVLVEGKLVLVVAVAKGSEPFYSYKNIVYKRVGSSDMPLSPDRVVELAKRAGVIRFDEQLCEQASLDDIDEEKVRWYLERREEIRQVKPPKGMPLPQLLLNLNAAKKDDGKVMLTNAGVLFFSENPRRFFVQAQLRLVRFKGTELTDDVIDRFDCTGPVWEMVEQAETFLRKTIRLLSSRTERSFRREDRFEYPIRALREGIINALIHRSYFEPADVRVMVFDDRVEITSPGTFPEGVSPEKPEHRPVNPTLCSLMYDIGFIEKYGSGIYMMRELCRKSGNEGPLYELGSIETKLIFKSPVGEITRVELEGVELNERQRKAVEYVRAHGRITNREYRELCGVSHKTAHLELSDLIEKGVLVRGGTGRSTYYSFG